MLLWMVSSGCGCGILCDRCSIWLRLRFVLTWLLCQKLLLLSELRLAMCLLFLKKILLLLDGLQYGARSQHFWIGIWNSLLLHLLVFLGHHVSEHIKQDH